MDVTVDAIAADATVKAYAMIVKRKEEERFVPVSELGVMIPAVTAAGAMKTIIVNKDRKAEV
ncbi:MAG: hypothetical protein LBT06_09165 [Hungatella sp.]|uniref:hypothetical protein n=1 Tax=Clostridium sp. NkU-1 TaxID=1095009 RepID=UPI0006D13E3B|nr:hypothetical protein [Hungatella sp.]MDR1548741.1 hypothetical protein [Hungatella sp.]MDR1773016.1 hypothetical protein [Hungatella sp.]MDR2024454.1 hypothetical protein [Hungatella sp.]